MTKSIKLKAESILQVPLQNYENNFAFIVNSERFETSSIFADLLSPIISKQRLSDPTVHEFSLKTKSKGDFREILNLISFKDTSISENNISFIIEVLTQLGTQSIDVFLPSDNQEITEENVLENVKTHQKYPFFYKDQLQKEIDFISENFSTMKENLIKFIKEENNDDDDVIYDLIESIIDNKKLLLENEDELLQTINDLYLINRKYSFCYQYVDFVNVEVSSINNFVSIFNADDITTNSWISIVQRLQQKVDQENEKTSKHKLKKKQGIDFQSQNDKFDGIFRYLKTNGNIINEVSITSSSNNGYDHYNMLDLDNITSFFQTNDTPNSWICFEFKNHQIIPQSYIIRTINGENNYHLKSWVVEGSNDKSNWIKIDEHKNDNSLKGQSRVHLFNITKNSNEQLFKYIRILQTGPNWFNNNDRSNILLIGSIEFYGRLI